VQTLSEIGNKLLNSKTHIYVTILLAVTISLMIRIHNLGTVSFFWDETFTWYVSESTDQIIAKISRDVHPPAYFFFVSIWKDLFGISEFSLRFPSVLFSIFTLLSLVHYASAISRSHAVAFTIIISTMFVFSPLDIHLSRFARQYTLIMFLCTCFSYSLFEFAFSGNKRFLIFSFFIALLAIYSHYMALVYVTATIITIILIKPSRSNIIHSLSSYNAGALLHATAEYTLFPVGY